MQPSLASGCVAVGAAWWGELSLTREEWKNAVFARGFWAVGVAEVEAEAKAETEQGMCRAPKGPKQN